MDMNARVDSYSLSDVAPVFNLIQHGSAQGNFSDLYCQPAYMAGLGIQLFTLLFGCIRLPDRRWYRARARVLRVDGTFGGFIIFRHDAPAMHSTEIYMCAVTPAHREKGLGTWMLKTALSDIPAGHRVYAQCLPRSDHMKALLRKLGFGQENSRARRSVPQPVQRFVYTAAA
jgi:RimJ/RimL family protein N-acetyltransferase